MEFQCCFYFHFIVLKMSLFQHRNQLDDSVGLTKDTGQLMVAVQYHGFTQIQNIATEISGLRTVTLKYSCN